MNKYHIRDNKTNSRNKGEDFIFKKSKKGKRFFTVSSLSINLI